MAGYEPRTTIPVIALETSLATWVPPATVLPILSKIEQLPDKPSGALLVGREGEEHGAVLVDRGRVSWAASHQMANRLTTLLRYHAAPQTTAAELEKLYADCRNTKTPLFQSLLDRGFVTRDMLASILLQHSAEAVVLLATQEQSEHSAHLRWAPCDEDSLRSEPTFSATAILATIGAFWDPEESQRARACLGRSVSERDCGLAFMRAGGALFPVGEVGAHPLQLTDVLEAGVWAREQLDVARALADGTKLASCASSTGEQAAVAWQRGDVVFLVFSASRRSYTRLVSRLCREFTTD